MKHAAYKITALAILSGLITGYPGIAQDSVKIPVAPMVPIAPVAPVAPEIRIEIPVIPEIKLNNVQLQENMKNINIQLQEKLKVLNEKLARTDFKKIDLAMVDLNKRLTEKFKDFDMDFKSLENLNQLSRLKENYQGIKKTRVISKTYSVDRNDKLAIDNQYGKVIITTWNKNEIKVDVEVNAFESSDSRAQELLDGVTINDARQTNLISFKTSIERSSGSWWVMRKNGQEEGRGVQVNYIVYMPSKNPLDISNKYGSIVIPDFDGALNINSSYGSFSGQALKNTGNTIKVSYGSAKIESLKAGSLDVSYGSLNLINADQLNANVRYSSAVIGKLSGDADINIKYCSGFKVGQVDGNVKNLNINAGYSSVSLGFNPSASFDFDVTVSYAGFQYDDHKVNILSKDPDNDSKGWNPIKNYKGTYGKGSGSRVIIKSSYGSVKFL